MIYMYLTQLHEWISLLQQLVVFRSKIFVLYAHVFFMMRFVIQARGQYTQVNAIHQYEL